MRAGPLLVFAFLFVLAAPELPTTPATVSAGGGVISPGGLYNNICTLNFVYDGVGQQAGNVYIGTAGHCTSVGAAASTRGVSNFGVTVYDNDHVDVALIEIHPAFHASVSPHVLGHFGMPKGVTDYATETATGDTLLLSGHGMGFGLFPLTRENRIGVLTGDNADTFRANTLLVNGDSGGPILHEETGKALGIVSHYAIGYVPPSTDAGPTVNGALAAAAADGFTVQLRVAS